MCPPVSPCKGASIVIPTYNACVLGMETPLCGRSGGHIGTAPTVSFGWIACECRIAFGQIARGRLVAFGQILRKWLMCVADDMFKIVIECREGTTPSVLYFCQPRVADDRRLP